MVSNGRYMGPSAVEGIKTLIERPKTILLWVDDYKRWRNEEEFNHRVAEKYERTWQSPGKNCQEGRFGWAVAGLQSLPSNNSSLDSVNGV